MQPECQAAIDEFERTMHQKDNMIFKRLVVTMDPQPVGSCATVWMNVHKLMHFGYGGNCLGLSQNGIQLPMNCHTDIILAGEYDGLVPQSTFEIAKRPHPTKGDTFQIEEDRVYYMEVLNSFPKRGDPELWLAEVEVSVDEVSKPNKKIMGKETIELTLGADGVPKYAKSMDWKNEPLVYKSVTKLEPYNLTITHVVTKKEKGIWGATVSHANGAKEDIEVWTNETGVPTYAKASTWSGVPLNFKAGPAKVNLRLWRGDTGLKFVFKDPDEEFRPWHACVKSENKPRERLMPVRAFQLTKMMRVKDVLALVGKCKECLVMYDWKENNCHDFCAMILAMALELGLISDNDAGQKESNYKNYTDEADDCGSAPSPSSAWAVHSS